jgi:hypothetical protein
MELKARKVIKVHRENVVPLDHKVLQAKAAVLVMMILRSDRTLKILNKIFLDCIKL